MVKEVNEMKKYGYSEIRKVEMHELRKLAILKNWFTNATEEEYAQYLNYANCDNITSDELVEMATLVKEYSNADDYEYTTIMFEIAQVCYTFFEED